MSLRNPSSFCCCARPAASQSGRRRPGQRVRLCERTDTQYGRHYRTLQACTTTVLRALGSATPTAALRDRRRRRAGRALSTPQPTRHSRPLRTREKPAPCGRHSAPRKIARYRRTNRGARRRLAQHSSPRHAFDGGGGGGGASSPRRGPPHPPSTPLLRALPECPRGAPRPMRRWPSWRRGGRRLPRRWAQRRRAVGRASCWHWGWGRHARRSLTTAG
jgi:hypothetical protein